MKTEIIPEMRAEVIAKLSLSQRCKIKREGYERLEG